MTQSTTSAVVRKPKTSRRPREARRSSDLVVCSSLRRLGLVVTRVGAIASACAICELRASWRRRVGIQVAVLECAARRHDSHNTVSNAVLHRIGFAGGVARGSPGALGHVLVCARAYVILPAAPKARDEEDQGKQNGCELSHGIGIIANRRAVVQRRRPSAESNRTTRPVLHKPPD